MKQRKTPKAKPQKNSCIVNNIKIWALFVCNQFFKQFEPEGMCLFLIFKGYHQEKINSSAALLSLSCLSNVCLEKKCFKLVMLFTLFFFKIPSTASPKSCPRGVIICDKKNFASATFELQKFFLAARRRLFKSRENFFISEKLLKFIK